MAHVHALGADGRMHVKGVSIDGKPSALGQRLEYDHGKLTVVTYLFGNAHTETFDVIGKTVTIKTFG